MNSQQRTQLARAHRRELKEIRKKYGSVQAYWKRIAFFYAIAKHTVGIRRVA